MLVGNWKIFQSMGDNFNWRLGGLFACRGSNLGEVLVIHLQISSQKFKFFSFFFHFPFKVVQSNLNSKLPKKNLLQNQKTKYYSKSFLKKKIVIVSKKQNNFLVFSQERSLFSFRSFKDSQVVILLFYSYLHRNTDETLTLNKKG